MNFIILTINKEGFFLKIFSKKYFSDSFIHDSTIREGRWEREKDGGDMANIYCSLLIKYQIENMELG